MPVSLGTSTGDNASLETAHRQTLYFRAIVSTSRFMVFYTHSPRLFAAATRDSNSVGELKNDNPGCLPRVDHLTCVCEIK